MGEEVHFSADFSQRARHVQRRRTCREREKSLPWQLEIKAASADVLRSKWFGTFSCGEMDEKQSCSSWMVVLCWQGSFKPQIRVSGTKHRAPIKRNHCKSRWKDGVTVKQPGPPPRQNPPHPRAANSTLGRARSTTCLQAFPVCCNHGRGIIRSAFRASSQWCESNADFSDLRSGAAAGGLRPGWFQSKNCETGN